MSLAQRVRDFRYSKGWGPDELANRAEISRTALYQIESGKTELPRAGTLRRIAVALEVSMDTLLGHAEPAQAPSRPARNSSGNTATTWTRGTADWYPGEGSPMATPSPRHLPRFELTEGPRFATDYGPSAVNGYDGVVLGRERELTSKFQELLASPLGEGLARIVEEMHRIVPQTVAANAVGSSVRGL